jgi:hypothetical protein
MKKISTPFPVNKFGYPTRICLAASIAYVIVGLNSDTDLIRASITVPFYRQVLVNTLALYLIISMICRLHMVLHSSVPEEVHFFRRVWRQFLPVSAILILPTTVAVGIYFLMRNEAVQCLPHYGACLQQYFLVIFLLNICICYKQKLRTDRAG